LLELAPESLKAEILCLGETKGKPNPGVPSKLGLERRNGTIQLTHA
jgi:hypothetical protein